MLTKRNVASRQVGSNLEAPTVGGGGRADLMTPNELFTSQAYSTNRSRTSREDVLHDQSPEQTTTTGGSPMSECSSETTKVSEKCLPSLPSIHTLLEESGIEAPVRREGIQQQRAEGPQEQRSIAAGTQRHHHLVMSPQFVFPSAGSIPPAAALPIVPTFPTAALPHPNYFPAARIPRLAVPIPLVSYAPPAVPVFPFQAALPMVVGHSQPHVYFPARPPNPIPLVTHSSGPTQHFCCVKECRRLKTRRKRESMRLLEIWDFKPGYLRLGWTRVCAYHYFSSLYKYKKLTGKKCVSNRKKRKPR